MRTLFAVSVLCLVLITGCVTSPPVLFTFDLPEYSSYTREVNNRELVLNVIDVNNIGVKIIKHPAAYENGYSDKPIKSYYTESMNKVLTDIGFKLSEFTDYEFRVYILDAYVQWGMGLNVEVTSVFRSRIEITCSPDDKIVFENEYNTKRVVKATAGGPSSIPYVKRLFKNTLEAHMNEIISSINFHEIFIKSDDDSDNINQGDTPEVYIKDARRNNLPIITVFDFEYEGISKNEASFLVDFLGGALFDTGNYRIIDRKQRESILSEIQFSMSGCTDESCQLEIGKLLAADYLVIGSLGKLGSRFIINAKLIDIELGETVLSAREIYPNVDAMIDGCDEFAVRLSVIK